MPSIAPAATNPSDSLSSRNPDATEAPPAGSAEVGGASPRRRFKNALKRALRKGFEIGQRCGFDVLPHHFYSSIPDIGELRAADSWKRPNSMIGVQGAEAEPQFEFVERCCTPAAIERQRRGDIYRAACAANGEPGFGPVDGDFLFAFIQAVRPRRIVQVGCGVSTAIVLAARQELPGYDPEIACVEPFPTAFLKRAHDDWQIKLIEERAQDVDLSAFTALGENDLLFVDSTHAVKPGSEVNRLILEVLPRLRAGCWVHFHDIYFPYDYQRTILSNELFFSSESTLLHAFLIHNSAYQIAASLSMLHYADPARLGRSLPNYRPGSNDRGLATSAGDFPGSIYLRVV